MEFRNVILEFLNQSRIVDLFVFRYIFQRLLDSKRKLFQDIFQTPFLKDYQIQNGYTFKAKIRRIRTYNMK